MKINAASGPGLRFNLGRSMLAKPPNRKRALEYLVALGAVTMERLPGSSLPDELRARGYEVTATGEGERILPAAITERFTRRADGELEPLVRRINQADRGNPAAFRHRKNVALRLVRPAESDRPVTIGHEKFRFPDLFP
jgi:hypothetical protein